MSKSLGERFWEKVNCDGPTQPHMETRCWEWEGAKDRGGYGIFNADGSARRAHRLSLSFGLGRMPGGHVLHKCDNPACVRPSHLMEGDHEENMRQRTERGRTSKGEGHTATKLTAEQVLAIRSSSLTYRVLAKQYGVALSLISYIKNRKSWAHI